MGEILRKVVEDRRKKVINTLITYHLNQEENQYLFDLSLTELENEYRKLQSQGHPHSALSSIQWQNRRIVIHMKQDH